MPWKPTVPWMIGVLAVIALAATVTSLALQMYFGRQLWLVLSGK
jgi:hypothetical protein